MQVMILQIKDMMFDLVNEASAGMMLGYTLLWAVFGAIMGSFLNVVALRYNTGLSLQGRSGCFVCGKKLSWYELIPIVSYLVQKGRCTGCHSHISLQYFLVELGTGIFFALFGLHFLSTLVTGNNFDLIKVFVHFVIACILIVIFLYDIRHKIIPQGLVYTFIVLALVFLGIDVAGSGIGFGSGVGINAYFDADLILHRIVAPILVAAPLAFLWDISEGRWIGWGDIRLMVGVGAILGLVLGLSALLTAFYIGALVGITLLCTQKNTHLRTEVPFAPFIIIAFYIVLFSGLNVITFM